jgi:hypothetical protein
LEPLWMMTTTLMAKQVLALVPWRVQFSSVQQPPVLLA